MGTTADSLYERVGELIRSHKREPLLSTTGTRAAVGELMSRIVGLEEAINEIALEIQRREDSDAGLSADPGSAAVRETVDATDRVRDAAAREARGVGSKA